MTYFAIRQNDLRPNLVATLTDADGNTVDASGASSVKFNMRKVGSTTAKVSAACTVTSITATYAWTSTDTDTIGQYEGEFEVTWSDGDKQTFPVQNSLVIEVIDDIA